MQPMRTPLMTELGLPAGAGAPPLSADQRRAGTTAKAVRLVRRARNERREVGNCIAARVFMVIFKSDCFSPPKVSGFRPLREGFRKATCFDSDLPGRKFALKYEIPLFHFRIND